MSFSSAAQTGFAKAADYDAHRPSFPDESVNILLKNVGLLDNHDATVVDLAAGTGKFTEILAKRPEKFKIIAVEPHDDMRAVLEKKQLQNTRVVKGLSTAIPLPDGSVDAVIVAQAFHWFANLESLKEISRVLQPHGALGMIWNIEDYNAPRDHKAATPYEAKLHDFVWSLEDDTPRFRHAKWRDVFDDQLKSGPLDIATSAQPCFSLPLGSHEEKWTIWLTRDALWERFNTLSQVSTLQGKDKDAARALLNEAVEGEGTERNEKGEIAVHGLTYSSWTTHIPQ